MDVIELLKREEGFRPGLYKDSRGFWTCGHGFNVDSPPGREAPNILQLAHMVATQFANFTISEKESADILRAKVAEYLDELAPLGWFNDLNEVRKAAILSMRHQLGLGGLLHFPHMIAALANSDWQEAAAAALDSAWAHQTPNRAREIARMLETGSWPST